MKNLQFFKFKPILKPTIWGGSKIAGFKGLQNIDSNIGESWELSAIPGSESIVDEGAYAGKSLSELIDVFGADLIGNMWANSSSHIFPLLIKFIDTQDDLSIQVHPDDEYAAAHGLDNGKTEMWYILESTPDAKILSGFASKTSREEFQQKIKSNSLRGIFKTFPSYPGDVYFLPAGQVHSIGAGNLLLEIQQTSNTTYRIYDFDRRDAAGNPRELHIREALESINFNDCITEKTREGVPHNINEGDTQEINPSNAQAEDFTLIECDKFRAYLHNINPEVSDKEFCNNRDSFTIVVCIEGEGKIRLNQKNNQNISTAGTPTQDTPTDDILANNIPADNIPSMSIRRGETVLAPAAFKKFIIEGNLKVITITL